MTKTGGIYARDIDIGYPEEDNIHTVVQKLTTEIASINTAIQNLEEAVEELRKIRTGTGLILDGEIEEAV